MVSPIGTITPAGMMPKYRRFEVVAIFDSGMFEYDTSLAFISLPIAQRFFNLGDAVTGLQVNRRCRSRTPGGTSVAT